jgi:hypothetical protein
MREMKADTVTSFTGFAVFLALLLCSATATSAQEDEARLNPLPLHPVQATLLQDTDGKVVGFVQVDLLAFNRKEISAREQRKLAIQQRRQNMSAWEITQDHFKENWPWYVGGVIAAAAVDQTVIKNNEWLWHKSSKPSNRQAGGDLIGDDTATAIAIANSVSGSGNTINQTIVIQAPQGSGTGAQGNTGSGGIANPTGSYNTSGN